MMTKNDIDKILVDVNRVLANIDERITKLEKESKAPAKSTASKAASKES